MDNDAQPEKNAAAMIIEMFSIVLVMQQHIHDAHPSSSEILDSK